MIALELLRQQKLLCRLDLDLLEKLRKEVVLREYSKRSFVLQEGGAGDALLLLFSGRLQVITVSEKGKEVGVNFIEPGDHFGEISLIDGMARSASVQSLTNSIVGFLPKAQALWLFFNNPIVAEQVQKRLCQTIRKEIGYRSSFSNTKAFQRVYAVIYDGHLSLLNDSTSEQVDATNSTHPKSQIIQNLPTQQSIASMANVSRETVSRAINTLVGAGIIEKKGRDFWVHDPHALRKLALGQAR